MTEQRNAQRRKQRAQRKAHAAELARVELLTPLESLDYLVEAAGDYLAASGALIDAAEANVRAVLEEHEEQRPRTGR